MINVVIINNCVYTIELVQGVTCIFLHHTEARLIPRHAYPVTLHFLMTVSKLECNEAYTVYQNLDPFHSETFSVKWINIYFCEIRGLLVLSHKDWHLNVKKKRKKCSTVTFECWWWCFLCLIFGSAGNVHSTPSGKRMYFWLPTHIFMQSHTDALNWCTVACVLLSKKMWEQGLRQWGVKQSLLSFFTVKMEMWYVSTIQV